MSSQDTKEKEWTYEDYVKQQEMLREQRERVRRQRVLDHKEMVEKDCKEEKKGKACTPWSNTELLLAFKKAGICSYTCKCDHCQSFRNCIDGKCYSIKYNAFRERLEINFGYGYQNLGIWRHDLQKALRCFKFYPY